MNLSFYRFLISLLISLNIYQFITPCNSSSRNCKLKDGSSHACPDFNDNIKNLKLFTAEELLKFDGEHKETSKIYLAVIGEVFDVTSGKRHYGPNAGHYHGFTGKDGSRAFAIGGFTDKELIPDITDLNEAHVNSVYDWMTFYRKDYKFVGKLIGFYYDSNGNPTKNRFLVEEKILESYYISKKQKAMGERYPRCNSQRGSAVRNRIWCTRDSGGISRDWIGVPRIFRDPTLGEQGSTRCACVPLGEANDETRFKMYDEYPCAFDAHECFLEPGNEFEEREADYARKIKEKKEKVQRKRTEKMERKKKFREFQEQQRKEKEIKEESEKVKKDL